MSKKLVNAINSHFEKNRLIFWYDDEGSQFDIFEQFQDPGIEKVELENNEFLIKYRVLKEMPDKKFLIYSKDPRPADGDNWLLDLNLECFVFATTEAAMILQELGLHEKFQTFLEEHLDFFRNETDRKEPFTKQLTDKETERSLQYAMLSVLCGKTKQQRSIRKDLKTLLVPILEETFQPSQPCFDSIIKYGLEEFFWEEVKKIFTYETDDNSLKGLAFFLFRSAFHYVTEQCEEGFARETFTFIDSWRSRLEHIDAFKTIANSVEKELNMEHELQSPELQLLINTDLFKCIDGKILRLLTDGALHDSLELDKAISIIATRKEKYWYATETDTKLRDYYLALEAYFKYEQISPIIADIPSSVADIWNYYINTLHTLDTLHRSFIYHYNRTIADSNFNALLVKLEKHYVNSFIYALQKKWEGSLQGHSLSGIDGVAKQSMFFKKNIAPYLREKKIVFVIISDALRFECGFELRKRLLQNNRFQVDIDSMMSAVPSYTALGMSQLLPHEAITIEGENGAVLADNQNTAGIQAREKVIKKYFNENSPGKQIKAMQANEFIGYSLQEQERLIAGIDVFYLFSNTIDSTGDNAKSENALAKAVEEEIQFLHELCKKITNLNRTHIVITADHGFLYQYSDVKPEEYLSIPKMDGEIVRNRRFIIGKNLSPVPGCTKLAGEDVGIQNDLDILVAQGLTRIRISGGGHQFVHGGMSLQETCIPVIKIKKGREDDVQVVDVEVLKKGDPISSGDVSITFYQQTPTDEKFKKRTLVMRFESPSGDVIISNNVESIFDKADSIDENRTKICNFSFSKEASRFNNGHIVLRLYDKKEGGTLVHYKEITYRYRIYLEKDFDI